MPATLFNEEVPSIQEARPARGGHSLNVQPRTPGIAGSLGPRLARNVAPCPSAADLSRRRSEETSPAGRRADEVSVAGLGEEPPHVRQRRDEGLARNRHVAMGEHGGAHPLAISAIAAEDDVDLLLADDSRHGMAAGQDEAVRPPLRPPGREHDAGPGPDPPTFLLLDDDLDSRRQDALED